MHSQPTPEDLWLLEVVREQLPAILWTTDRDLIITSGLGAGLAGIGMRPGESVGTPLYDRLGTRDPNDPAVAAHLGALAGERSTYEYSYLGRDFWAHVGPLLDAGGAKIGTIGLALDITERRRAQEDLARAEGRLRALTGSAQVILWQADPKSCRFTYVSREGAEALLGFPAERWTEDPTFWMERLHPDDRDRVLSLCRVATQEGRPHEFECRLIAADGREVWVHDIVKLVMRDGVPVEAVGLMLDITDRKKVEAERDALLQEEQGARRAAVEAERRTAFLAEASTLLATSLDFETTIVGVARLAAPSLGDWCVVDVVGEDGALRRVAVWHPDPAKAELARDLQKYSPDPDKFEGITRVVRTARPVVYSYLTDAALSGQGPYLPVAARDAEHLRLIRELGLHSYMSVPLLARGRTLGALTFASLDPDRYGPAELALAEALAERCAVAIDNARLHQEVQRAVHSREEFLSIASHELRTPLTSLQLALQNLLDMARNDALARATSEVLTRSLEIAERKARRLSELCETLLDVSRAQAGRLELHLTEVDLSAVTRDVASHFREELDLAGCSLDLQAGDPVMGRWDRARLEQVVTNLLSNALKYGAGRPITVAVSDSGGRGRLSVADQGIGIAPERQGQIFDRFARAVSAQHYGGMGLGLYIVRRILEAHGGAISVESEPGCGTTFTVELPCAGPPAPREEPA